MEFCKYEFSDVEWLENKIKIQQSLDGNISFVGCSVVELGYIVKVPAIIEDGLIKTDAILSDKYCVDILWDDKPIADFNKFEVYPAPFGIHVFGGFEVEYENKYYDIYPEKRKTLI